MTQRVRIGIFSFAHLHAESYIGALRSLPDVEFIGIADDNQLRGEHYAGVYNAPLFPSYQAMLDEGEPDGVVICSENSRHLPLIELAHSYKVGVLSEKPLATTLADAERAVELCLDGAVLKTAFPLRFNAPAMEVHHLITSGSLGKVYAINGTNQGQCPQRHRAWFVDPVLAGGGAIADHTVHLTDMMRWMLNSEPVEVYAEANHILYRDAAPDVETGGIVSLKFADGTIATIDCSWNKPLYYPIWGGLAMDVISSSGLTTMNAFGQNLNVYRHSLERAAYAPWGSDADRAMLMDFVAALRGEESRGASGYDGLRAVAVVAAAYESIRAGEPVPVVQHEARS